MECAGLAFKTSGGVVGLVGATAMWTTAFYRSEQPVFDFGRSRPLSQFRYPGHETVRGTALARLATAAWASTFGPGKLCGWATVSWHDLQSGQLDVAGSHGRLRACGGGFLCGPMSGPNNYGCAPWE